MTKKLDAIFAGIEAKKGPVRFGIRSDRLGLNYQWPRTENAETGTGFHTASVAKLFTAVVAFRLIERGLFKLDTVIADLTDRTKLEKLFVYKGTDFSREVTVRQLLGHTSGAADYFGGPVSRKPKFTELVLSNPEKIWLPSQLLAFSAENQKTVAPAGKKFYYSDTGYILLGLIIEKAAGKKFGDVLEKELFAPLGMTETFLIYDGGIRNRPEKIIDSTFLSGIDIASFKSISCDWAGGGVASTISDLLAFDAALRGGELINAEHLALMDDCGNKFRAGIRYGLGMMEIRFEEFFFLWRGLPRLKGHIGVLATHLFYDPVHDAHIAMSLASDKRMVESFVTLGKIMTLLGP